MNQGIETKLLGEKLTEKYGPKNVFYDHGNSKNENVCECKAIMDKETSTLTHLADVDIVILNRNNNTVDTIIEIEEDKNTAPKKLLGDLFAICLADNISISQNTFQITKDTKVIIGVKVDSKGQKKEKFGTKIPNHIREKHKKVGNIPTENLTIITYRNIKEMTNEISLDKSLWRTP